MARLFAAALLLAGFLVGRADADEPKSKRTADDVAAAVVNAWRAKNQAQVRALAAEDAPDPWLVADAVLLLGVPEAAAAFAKASPRKDVERLPEFVAAWSHGDADRKARALLAAGNKELAADRHAEAAAKYAAVPAGAMPYLRARCLYGAGLALAREGKMPEAAERLGAVVALCEGLGWLSRAAVVLWDLVRVYEATDDVAACQGVLDRLIALESARGVTGRLATAYAALGTNHNAAERWDDAHAAFTRAFEIWQKTGDRPRQAQVLIEIAWASRERKRTKEAEDAVKHALVLLKGEGAHAARGYAILGLLDIDAGRLTTALELYRKGLAAARTVRDDVDAARMEYMLGRLHGELGDHASALAPLRESIRIAKALAPPRADFAHIARARLAWSLVALGKTDEARPLVAEGVREAESTQDPLALGIALRAQARLLRAEGKVEDAVLTYRQAHAELETAKEAIDARLVLVEIAETYDDARDLPQARQAADLALAAATKQGDPFAVAKAQAVAARIRRDQGHAPEALELARSAANAFQGFGDARATRELTALVSELEAAAAPR
jgi:tetratricopeptide (TPR) repeat protein